MLRLLLVLASLASPHAFAPHVQRPALSRPPRPACHRSQRAAVAPTMGVPKFFRWLTERFPQINRRISEGRRADDYVDNFYLDMNGIIHTCTHGDGIRPGAEPPEDEMVAQIFEYTERLIRIASPRKLIYLAIDGVAPRAKMNQQRSRRYRAPREAAQLAAQLEAQGKGTPSGAHTHMHAHTVYAMCMCARACARARARACACACACAGAGAGARRGPALGRKQTAVSSALELA